MTGESSGLFTYSTPPGPSYTYRYKFIDGAEPCAFGPVLSRTRSTLGICPTVDSTAFLTALAIYYPEFLEAPSTSIGSSLWARR